MSNKTFDFTDIRKGQAIRIMSNYKETDKIVKAFNEEEIKKSDDGDADSAQFDKGRKGVNRAEEPFSKAQSEAERGKMEKVMKEFKEGTLKSSSGEKVTDRSQALAIALSEAKSIKKAENEVKDAKTNKIDEASDSTDRSFDPNEETKLAKAYEILGL